MYRGRNNLVTLTKKNQRNKLYPNSSLLIRILTNGCDLVRHIILRSRTKDFRILFLSTGLQRVADTQNGIDEQIRVPKGRYGEHN